MHFFSLPGQLAQIFIAIHPVVSVGHHFIQHLLKFQQPAAIVVKEFCRRLEGPFHVRADRKGGRRGHIVFESAKDLSRRLVHIGFVQLTH
jgi:hypothetical protein